MPTLSNYNNNNSLLLTSTERRILVLHPPSDARQEVRPGPHIAVVLVASRHQSADVLGRHDEVPDVEQGHRPDEGLGGAKAGSSLILFLAEDEGAAH